MLEPGATWSDVFTPTRRAKTHGGWKTTPADKITWHGILNGRVVCVVSTVRLIEGGMAHLQSAPMHESGRTPGIFMAATLSTWLSAVVTPSRTKICAP